MPGKIWWYRFSQGGIGDWWGNFMVGERLWWFREVKVSGSFDIHVIGT